MLWLLVRFSFASMMGLAILASQALADPDETVRSADQVLHEVMSSPGRRIPEALLAEAQGVAIVPDVIKVGFVAGIRRGHGVVLVRDGEGTWSWPQFVTLTGGSVGWQAGVQGSDIVLVFMTRKSIDGLLRGKFTVGADASVAAGPVGRNAAAATDTRLKAEILSYSRSRGLFAGIALDGTAIEIDGEAHRLYYGSFSGQPPMRTPESALKLRQDLIQMTPLGNAGLGLPEANQQAQAAMGPDALRQQLRADAGELYRLVDEPWQKYLALPPEVFQAGNPPGLDALQRSLAQFDKVAASPKYQVLIERPEFRSAHQSLREYARSRSETAGPTLAVPPPPR
jgi:SH3 domain-containing YSC84-like protein 1